MARLDVSDAAILIVDHQPANVRIAERILERAGFTNIISTTDAREVMRLIERFSPRILLLELQLSYLNGFAVMDLVRAAIPPETFFPILVMTGNRTAEIKRQALSRGAADFVGKPVDASELVLRVRNLLSMRRLHEELRHQNQVLEERVRERTRELEESIRLKESFLMGAAHELRTPLTALIGQTQLIERQFLRDPDHPVGIRDIQSLHGGLKRLNHVVGRLVDALRADQGQLVRAREQTDLAAVAREALQGACGHAEPQRCRLIADEAVIGNYDPVRIAQLIRHLVDNALEYSPEESQVRVQVWRDGSEARLSVTDHGIGIPANDVPHVLERFYRGTNIDQVQYPGMGLSLYICRTIAEQHGGRIWVDSSPTATVFHVALPLAPTLDRPL